MKKTIKLTTWALLLIMMFSIASVSASAVGDENKESEAIKEENSSVELTHSQEGQLQKNVIKWQLTTEKVSNLSIWAHPHATILYNGEVLDTDARIINGTTYVSLRSFINETTSMSVTYNSAQKNLRVTGGGLELSVTDGSNVIYANGRTLFTMTPAVIMNNGRMYVPVRPLVKALGLSVWQNFSTGVAAISGRVSPLAHGNTVYDSDAVYWLSRIISSESKGEPLLGQIAVGNVVLNRVKSPLYPNTIWGVIFDRKYGVQFSPIIYGTIYHEPTASAITAAKICLEGHTVTTHALFFLQPRISTSSWIPNSRTYIFSIGNHDFYS